MPLNCRRHEVYSLETMHIFVPAQKQVYGCIYICAFEVFFIFVMSVIFFF